MLEDIGEGNQEAEYTNELHYVYIIDDVEECTL